LFPLNLLDALPAVAASWTISRASDNPLPAIEERVRGCASKPRKKASSQQVTRPVATISSRAVQFVARYDCTDFALSSRKIKDISQIRTEAFPAKQLKSEGLAWLA
jgi:hypothetical protein